MPAKITIATRGSKLALIQSTWVAERLKQAEPGLEVELLKVTTTGDKILDVPLAKVGGKGLFVKEIEEAILEGRAELAVHSIKDMPVELPPKLHLAATPARVDRRDAFISASGAGLAGLPKGARVGTSSLRRAALLLALRPDLKIVSIRGNVDTRLRKLEAGEVEAVVLAAAGLARMDLGSRVTEFLDPEAVLPAVGQGALGLECGRDDEPTNLLLQKLNHAPTWEEIQAERAFLAGLEGGCQVPIACLSAIEGDSLSLQGLVASPSGRPIIREKVGGPVSRAAALGSELAATILALGGREILDEVYSR